MKYLRVIIPLVVLLMLAIPSSVSAEATVVTWESYTTGSDNATTVYGGNWMAQSFNVSQESHSAYWVKLSLNRTGTPGTVVVGIREVDDNGLPTGDDLTTGTLDADVLGNAPAEWYTIVMTEYSLSYNTTYAIVVSAEEGDASNALYVMSDDSAAAYTGGTKIYSTTGGLTWLEDAGHDLQFAISGRALINVEDVNVFTNLYETGDMLFAIQYSNTYVPLYPLDSVQSYFAFQLRDTDGTTLISQVTCSAWGDPKPSEIYLSADAASPLDYGSAYMVVLEGIHLNESPSANYTLTNEDWRGSDLSRLDEWVINLAQVIEDEYGITMLVASGRDNILNEDGGVVFLVGMPSLIHVRPDLFEVGVAEMEDYATDSYSFDSVTVYSTEVGETITAAVEATADVVGIEEPVNVARVLVLILGIGLAGLVVKLGGDWTVAFLLVAIPVIIAGTQFRIYPFAFIATISGVAVLLLVYRFTWGRT